MDTNELRSLQEAYLEVVEGQQLDEDSRRKALRQEEVSVYDIVLSHLIDEGYADTVESAEGIMVNMSEEWRDDIVEELTGERRKRAQEKIRELRPKGRRRKSTDAAVSAIDRVTRSKEGGKDPSKFPTKRGGEGEKGKMKSYRLGGSSDRGSGNKAARRAGTYIDHETDY